MFAYEPSKSKALKEDLIVLFSEEEFHDYNNR